MALYEFEFRCERGHTYRDALAVGHGAHVLRGWTDPTPALVDLEQDPAFAELCERLDGLGATAGLDDRGKHRLRHGLFGLTCDPAPDGTAPALGRFSRCPWCGGSATAFTQPEGTWSGPEFEVGHVLWNALSEDEKQALVAAALQTLGFTPADGPAPTDRVRAIHAAVTEPWPTT